jgi:type IV pilus assembly protein PilV
MNTFRSHRGFSLVEMLVALIVMSVGMLGIAALYIESMKSNRGASLRTQAVALAYDMADRIRANRLAGAQYALALGAAPPAAHNCVAGVNCTQDDMADDDLNRWVTSVRAIMPWDGATPPKTAVVFTAAAGVGRPDTYQVTITWREPNQDPGEPDYAYNLNMQVIPTPPT